MAKIAQIEGHEYDGVDWEYSLATTVVSDDNWSASIAMVAASIALENELIGWLQKSVRGGCRSSFRAVIHSELLQWAEAGGPGGKTSSKTKDAYSEVWNAAKAQFAELGFVTEAMIAKIIKQQVIHMKNEDTARRNSVGADKSGGGGKKDRKQNVDVLDPIKLNKLKPSSDSSGGSTVADEPYCGPQLYIILFGFHEASILKCLEDNGVYIDTVIKIVVNFNESVKSEESEPTGLRSYLPPGYDEQHTSQTAMLNKFWDELDMVLNSAGPSSKLNNIIIQDLFVRSTDIPSITNTSEVQEKFQSYLYTQMAKLLYSVQDLKRHHRNYLRHLKLVRIPSYMEKIEDYTDTQLPLSPGLEGSTQIVDVVVPSMHVFEMPDIQHYKNLMDAYPMECSTVPIILHCILEQVVTNINTDHKKPDPPTGKKKEHYQTFDGKEPIETEFDTIKQNLLLTGSLPAKVPTPSAPLILYNGDHLMLSTHHLWSKVPPNFNSIHSKMLHTHPVLSFVKKFPCTTSYQMKEQQARFHQFLSLFKVGEVSNAEIDRALKQFMFESMMTQVASGTGKLVKCPQNENPWDDPYSIGHDGAHGPFQKTHFAVSGSCVLHVGTFSTNGKPLVCESEKIFLESCQSESQNSLPATCRLCWQPCYQRTCTAPTEITCECTTLLKPPICCECWNKLNKPAKQFDLASRAQSASAFGSSINKRKMLCPYFRNLEDHVYIECFSPNVMYQVLYDALQSMACVDILFCRRDRCHLLIMHNPCNCSRMQMSTWEVKLNTNIALRNFKMHVWDLIKGWIDEEEENYQAMLRELRDSNQLKPSDGQKECVLPCTSMANILGDMSWVPGVIQSSLKFKKYEERTVTRAEKTPKEAQKEAQSKNKIEPAPKKPVDQTEKCKQINEKWQSSKRQSSQSPVITSSPTTPERHPSSANIVHRDKDEFMFQGYNLGNVMLHISGSTTHLYPGDGAQIRVESYSYLYGRTRTTVTIKHNNNSFYMHSPINEHHSFWPSSFQALLSNGVRLIPRLVSYSTKVATEYEVISSTGMWGELNSRSISRSTGNIGSPRHSTGKSDQHSGWSGWKAHSEDLLEVTISLPNGLVVHILPDSSNAQSHLLVRQTFTLKQSHSPDEVSRTITAEGQVIRLLTGHRTEILQPDGTILKADWTSVNVRIPTPESIPSSTHSVTTGGGQATPANVFQSRSLDIERQATKKSSDSEGSIPKPSPAPSPPQMYPTGPLWTVTTATGRCFEVQTGVWTLFELYPMLSCVAIEPRTREKYITRDDGLHLVQKQGHHTIAHHYEGTRVTTYQVPSKSKLHSAETDQEIHVETPGFVPMVCRPGTGVIQLRITPDTLLTAKPSGHIVVRKDDGTELVFHRDGTILFTPVSGNKEKFGRNFSTYVMAPQKDVCLEAYDQQGRQFVVQNDGMVNVTTVTTENQQTSVGGETFEPKARYFEFHEDGSGSEFISEEEMSSSLERAASKPYTDIQMQPLPNDYFVQGVTVCLPLPKAPLDIWIIPYEMDNIVPKGLTCQDLQPFARAPVKDNHYIFAYNLGRGLNIGSLEKQVTTLAKLCDPPQVWKVRRFLKYRKLCPELRYIFENKLRELNRLITNEVCQKDTAHIVEYHDATEQALAQALLEVSKAIGVPRTCCNFVKSPETPEVLKTKVPVSPPVKKAVFKEPDSARIRRLSQIQDELHEHHKYLKILRHNEIPGYFKSGIAKIQERRASVAGKRKRPPYHKTTIEGGIPFREKSPPLMSPRQQKIMKEIRTPSSLQLIKSRPEMPKMIDSPTVEKCLIEPPSWARVEVQQGAECTIKRAAFKLKPSKLNFGTVTEGHTFTRRVFIQNLGISSSKYRVKQPPERTGIRVFYNSIPVGPGMTSKMDVELHAIMPNSVFGSHVGKLTYDLIILTEVEMLHLPVEAKIVSEYGMHEF